MKLVRESVNFKKEEDPVKSMGLGIDYDAYLEVVQGRYRGYDDFKVEQKENIVTWKEDTHDRYADSYEFTFDMDNGDLSAVISLKSGTYSTYSYDYEIDTPEELEKALEEWDNETPTWSR